MPAIPPPMTMTSMTFCARRREIAVLRGVTRGSEAPDAARLDGKTTDPEARLGAPDPKSAP
jgi:hypothetical protein